MGTAAKSTVKSASDGKKISKGLVKFHLKAKAPRRIDLKEKAEQKAQEKIDKVKEQA